jgi:gluconolactonase
MDRGYSCKETPSMTHVAVSASFEDLIDLEAPVERIATGFTFTEGPVWHPLAKYLLFSDMPGDVRRRWDRERGVAEVRRPSNKCNGMTYDADLNLIVCEHATSLLVCERPDGRRETLASHFEGKELNSPNDVCVRSDGSIYFTDPWYGRMPGFGVERPRELGFQGVYRLAKDGGLQLLVDRDLFAQPNGLCFSPDEKTLYVNDSAKALIRAFAVADDGSLSGGKIFAQGIRSETNASVPDGMKCDAEGNVWVTAPGGVWVYAASGPLIGELRVPELVANLAWGGDDFRTLFLTATSSVYAVATKVGPRREPYMAQRL